MRKLALIITAALIITSVFLFPERSLRPTPTGNTVIRGEEEGLGQRRRAWMDLLHSAAPGVDWQALEYQHRMARHLDNLARGAGRSHCNELISLAAGQVTGRWFERGSNNQAGSVFDTEYDPFTDRIWLISAGGTLWSGTPDGANWTVENQDLVFNPGLLKFIPRKNGRRMLAFTGRLPHFSDDDGRSWTPATGISHADRWGNFHSPIVLNDSLHTFFVFAKPSYWEPATLYKSVDQGKHFQPVTSFPTHEMERYAFCQPHHSPLLFLAEKAGDNGSANFYLYDPATDQKTRMNAAGTLRYGKAPANLVGWSGGSDSLLLFTYLEKNDDYLLYRSSDRGKTWALTGTLPEAPWEAGLFVSPSDPDLLLMGEVECARSTDGGKTWATVNKWWEYYDNVESKLHADIMHFGEFQRADGTPFLLVSNHGGLTISYDGLQNQQNIGMAGLNVSQYYSVRTDPTDPNYVYAGSQDQGFQIAGGFNIGDGPIPMAFEQVISGDYGHIIFTAGGGMWAVYPGGWVTYYDQPQTGTITASFELESDNESVWLPPLMPSPYPGEKAAYMAGGNINGGSGSYLIRLDYQDGDIVKSQSAFNFRAESGGGELSAMAVAPSDPKYWYAATTNGRFFYSEDGAKTWKQNLNFLPDGHYLYGQAIYVSRTNPQLVYLAGSGYSNPAVYRSLNGGKFFTAMHDGLPSTLIFDLDANEDESLLFAATEAGPFVYVTADKRWYELSGDCAPTHTYWSVEYVQARRTVRFGTYGRGIWDFQFEQETATHTLAGPATMVRAWPNPAAGPLNLEISRPGGDPIPVMVSTLNGRQVRTFTLYPGGGPVFTTAIDLSGLPPSVYLLEVRRKESVEVLKVVLR